MKNIKNKKCSENGCISPVDKTNKWLMNICIVIVIIIYLIPVFFVFSSGLFKSTDLNFTIKGDEVEINNGEMIITNLKSVIYCDIEKYIINGYLDSSNSNKKHLLLTFDLYDNNSNLLGRVKYEIKDMSKSNKYKVKAVYDEYDFFEISSFKLISVVGY